MGVGESIGLHKAELLHSFVVKDKPTCHPSGRCFRGHAIFAQLLCDTTGKSLEVSKCHGIFVLICHVTPLQGVNSERAKRGRYRRVSWCSNPPKKVKSRITFVLRVQVYSAI